MFEVKEFQCEYCPCRLTDRELMKKHEEVHREANEFKCDSLVFGGIIRHIPVSGGVLNESIKVPSEVMMKHNGIRVQYRLFECAWRI